MARPFLTAAALAAAIALPVPVAAADKANPMTESASWQAIREDVVGPAPIASAEGLIAFETPYRAEDAASVPIHLRQTDPEIRIEGAVVVIDENPAPVAGEFTFGPAMMPLDFALNIRVDQYSNVRAIARTPEGLRMAGGFVKASGGCSAPAAGDPEKALAEAGGMTLHHAGTEAAISVPRREAELTIRHPNHSGLQRDQVTQLFIPAQFIDRIEVRQGDELLWSMEGGISISANPVFRFAYDDNGAQALTVVATDTGGARYEQVLPKAAGG
ncbi:quinoprotein dehydrogenase-associated SoxYZ-like carrier [Salipiger mucosus]|uniref:Sulfur oxidation protein SoxY n=1 Tax=Salipiger mucosus DSM 16094 TaxID=1123237 RepID=S9RDD1_9RHOB|nr:quinoprotein dehydrogenase-associated SoxYZ-like carrier [Salipiger mucosus]EPX76120.1 hypothetical protein Salmuc_00773 [Salipiger mucosus DSM 16094]